MPSYLGYACWQSIFMHLDINQRLQLSICCPAFQSLHKRLPYKIVYLKLEGIDLEVDDVTYKVGVVRYYTKGTPPKWVLDENKRGGAHYDVEQYGRLDQSAVWERRNRDKAPKPEDIEKMKKKLAKLEGYREQCGEPEDGKEDTMLNLQINTFKNSLAEEEQWLAHSKAEFSHYLQITKVSKGVAKILGIAVYDRQIYHAEDYLIQTLFGNAEGIDKVVISDRSRYFNKLGYDHPFIMSAKFMEISTPPAWMTIRKVKNSLVRVQRVNSVVDIAEELIEAWLIRKPLVGTHFTVRKGERAEGEEVMLIIGLNPISRKLKLSNTKRPSLPYCYIFPLTDTSEIVVYCEFLKFDQPLRTRFLPYNLHFVVHPKGFPYQLTSQRNY